MDSSNRQPVLLFLVAGCIYVALVCLQLARVTHVVPPSSRAEPAVTTVVDSELTASGHELDRKE